MSTPPTWSLCGSVCVTIVHALLSIARCRGGRGCGSGPLTGSVRSLSRDLHVYRNRCAMHGARYRPSRSRGRPWYAKWITVVLLEPFYKPIHWALHLSSIAEPLWGDGDKFKLRTCGRLISKNKLPRILFRGTEEVWYTFGILLFLLGKKSFQLLPFSSISLSIALAWDQISGIACHRLDKPCQYLIKVLVDFISDPQRPAQAEWVGFVLLFDVHMVVDTVCDLPCDSQVIVSLKRECEETLWQWPFPSYTPHTHQGQTRDSFRSWLYW